LTLLFADDTAGLVSGPDLHPLLDKANLELQMLGMWFRANKMAVNVSKTKYIIFKPKGEKIELNKQKGIFFNNNDIGAVQDQQRIYKLDRIFDNNPIPQDRSYKLLGVLLDENLSFNQHCKLVCSKIAQSNYIIAKLKNLLSKKILKDLLRPGNHCKYCT
jgi:hypothetical protein